MAQLNFNPVVIDPAVMRDLQRCCARCGSKQRCMHDLEGPTREAAWRGYCPNCDTLEALTDEHDASELFLALLVDSADGSSDRR
jgi:hypothetical protein